MLPHARDSDDARLRPNFLVEMTSVAMDLVKVLDELKNERVLIERSILVLERLSDGHPKARGRPPRWMSDLKQKPRGRPKGSKNKPKENTSAA